MNARILVTGHTLRHMLGHMLGEMTLRRWFELGDYSASERRDLIQRIRRDQLTPGNPPQPTTEMGVALHLLR